MSATNVDVRYAPISGRIGRQLLTSAKCH